MTNMPEKNTAPQNEYTIKSLKKDVRNLLRRTGGIKTVGETFISDRMKGRILYFTVVTLLFIFLPLYFNQNISAHAQIYKYLIVCICIIFGYAYFTAGYVEDQILRSNPLKGPGAEFKSRLLLSYWKMALKHSFFVLGALFVLFVIIEFIPAMKASVTEKMSVIRPILLLDIPLWILLALAVAINKDIKKNRCPNCGTPYAVKLADTDITDRETHLINVIQTQNIYNSKNQIIGQAQVPGVEAHESYWLHYNYICGNCGHSYRKSEFINNIIDNNQ